MKKRLFLSAVSIGFLFMIIWLSWPTKQTQAPTKPSNTSLAVNVASDVDVPMDTSSDLIGFSTADLPDRDQHFNFTAKIPKAWRVEYVPAATAINIYDPKTSGQDTLMKSKIFILFYTATTFQSLPTFTVKSQSDLTINTRPAKAYSLLKKPNVKSFLDQPVWRNELHTMTVIRLADTSPAIFYTFAQAPDVSDEVFTLFIHSVQFNLK